MKGIEKEVDRLGRIVIPNEYRKRLGIKEGSRIVICFSGGRLYLEMVEGVCALCGKKLREGAPVRLCEDCLADIAEKVRP